MDILEWNGFGRTENHNQNIGNFVYLDGDGFYEFGQIVIWDISCLYYPNHTAMMQRRILYNLFRAFIL